MAIRQIAPPGLEPITVAMLRAQVRDDAIGIEPSLELAIAAARERCEHETGSKLIHRLMEQTIDAFPGDEILLGASPVAAIIAVRYLDADGIEQTVAPQDYRLDNTEMRAWLYPAAGTSWPATSDSINAVQIDLLVGYGAAPADVPAGLRAWVQMVAAYLYAQREAVDMTGRATALPDRWLGAMLDPFRVY